MILRRTFQNLSCKNFVRFFWNTLYTVSRKTALTIGLYNFDINQPMLIIFGRLCIQILKHQLQIIFPAKPFSCIYTTLESYTAGQRTMRTMLSRQLRCCCCRKHHNSSRQTSDHQTVVIGTRLTTEFWGMMQESVYKTLVRDTRGLKQHFIDTWT